jgi:hypothetical protein
MRKRLLDGRYVALGVKGVDRIDMLAADAPYHLLDV